jgi:RimJ/RimL family protein N-acetyltransferase
MKPRIEIHYRKISNKRLPIAGYRLHGYRDKDGKPIITKAVVKVDPRLKNNPRLARVIIKHESDEATARSKGLSLSKAHQVAQSKEPAWFRDKYKTHKQLLQALKP